jgi:lipopolysaccharide/colanic/teichoic acid biosynthesis glycosyltransferase
MKRMLDIVLSLTALILLSPLLILVALVLCCTGEGCVFYRQLRVGRGGRSFHLYKFATMLKDSPNLPGGLLTANNDPRILPVGRVLRATKVNEIPQLWNVLRGDMSLIGPRPQAREHFAMFPEHVKREIVNVRPGLSGIGSIVFRDEESLLARCGTDQRDFYENEIAPYKGELELWYIRHQSVALDLLLILLTLRVIVCPESDYCFRWLRDLPKPTSTILVPASLSSR